MTIMVRIAVRRQSVIPRPTGRRPGKFHRNLSTTSFGVKQTNKYDQKHNLPENVMAICESTSILRHFQMSTFCSPLYQNCADRQTNIHCAIEEYAVEPRF